MLSKSEIQFYKLALDRKWVTSEQVNRAIQLRKKDESATLVDVMVREGLLTREQADELASAPAPDPSQPPPQPPSTPQPVEMSRATIPVHAAGPAISSPTIGGSTPLTGGGLGSEARTFGKYEILGEIARGGMGIVYKVRPIGFDRVLAMKVILSGVSADDEERKRFVREAEVISRLRHPNVITVHDVGSVGEQYYYTMDFIEGKTLDVLVKEGLPTRRALEIIRDVSDAMAHAHAKGVIHRDLKPRNIIVDERGVPMVMDFGLAKSFDRGTKLTRSGATLGTPAYMSPEQAGGDLTMVDQRTDVYALGSILYELLAGRPPYTGDTAMEVLVQLMSTDARPLKELVPTLHRDIETICMRAVEKDLSRRYKTAGELRDDLDRYLKGDSILARPPGPATLLFRKVKKHRASFSVAMVLLVCGAAFLVWRGVERKRSEAREAKDAAKAEVVRAEALLSQGDLREAEAACDRALALDAGNAGALIARSRVHRAEGRLDLADEDARAAGQAAPDSAAAAEEQGNVALARGEAVRALAMYDQAVSLDGRNAAQVGRNAAQVGRNAAPTGRDAARVGRARALLAAGRAEEARKASEEALAHNPAPEFQAAAAVVKGKALEALGDRAGAHTCYAAGANASPRHADALLADGELFLAERNYDAAIDAFSLAIRIDWDLAVAYLGRGRAYYKKLQFDDAVQDLNDALARSRGDAPALVLLGQVYQYKGNATQAAKFFDEAVRVAPDDPAALAARGRALVRAGRRDEAETDLRHAVEVAPNDVTALNALGALLVARSDWNSAREVFARAVEIDGTHAESIGNVAWCEHRLEDREHAKADFERSRQFASMKGHEARDYIDLGDRLLSDARKKPVVKAYYAPALDAYAFAAGLNPRLAEAHVRRAEIHFLFGDFEEAKAEYEQALQADPYYIPAFLGRASLWRDHMKPPSPERAMGDVLAVLSFAPTDAGALTLRAELLCDTEKWEEALDLAERVLASTPRYPRAERVRTLCLVKLGRAEAGTEPPPLMTAGNRAKAMDHQTLGETCYNEQRFADALLAFTRAIEEDPSYSRAYYGRAAARYGLWQFAEAIMDYGRAIELEPRLEMKYLSTFPKVKPLAMSGWAKIRPQIDAKVPIEQPEAGVHLAYGFLALELDEIALARPHIERAIAIRPDFALGHSAMGLLLLREGKLEEAAKELERCIATDPRLISGYLFLAEVHALAGRRDQAMAQLHTAVNLGLEDFAYVTSSPSFDSLRNDPEFRSLVNVH